MDLQPQIFQPAGHAKPDSLLPSQKILTLRDQIHHRLRAGQWLIEAGCTPPASHSPVLLLAPLPPPQIAQANLPQDFPAPAILALSLSTQSALNADLAFALFDFLQDCGYTGNPLAVIALHEIITNSLIHGNLGVEAGPSLDWPHLNARHQNILQRCADPAHGSLTITVAAMWDHLHLIIAVADQGNGYDPCTTASPIAASPSLSLSDTV